jgi:hypothetical protein
MGARFGRRPFFFMRRRNRAGFFGFRFWRPPSLTLQGSPGGCPVQALLGRDCVIPISISRRKLLPYNVRIADLHPRRQAWTVCDRHPGNIRDGREIPPPKRSLGGGKLRCKLQYEKHHKSAQMQRAPRHVLLTLQVISTQRAPIQYRIPNDMSISWVLSWLLGA